MITHIEENELDSLHNDIARLHIENEYLQNVKQKLLNKILELTRVRSDFEITLSEAETLAKNCGYAHDLIGEDINPVNWGDASAFFIEGYDHALDKLEPIIGDLTEIVTELAHTHPQGEICFNIVELHNKAVHLMSSLYENRVLK